MYHAAFDEFVAISESLRVNSILGYLDGPLEDLLTEDMDAVLAQIHQCAISYHLQIGRGLCDVAPFGTLVESILAHEHLFPVCESDIPFHLVRYLNHFSWLERTTRYISFTTLQTSPLSLLIL
jgi:hypothetical protein